MFGFRGTVLTKRSNFAADLDVWRNANRDLYFAARAVKHIRLEMAALQRQYPGVQWGFFATGKAPLLSPATATPLVVPLICTCPALAPVVNSCCNTLGDPIDLLTTCLAQYGLRQGRVLDRYQVA